MSLRSIFKAIIDSVVETEPTSPITIPLQELSQIWLTRNMDASAASSAASQLSFDRLACLRLNLDLNLRHHRHST